MSDDHGFDKTLIMAPTVKMQPPPAAVLTCVGPAPPGTSEEINLVTSELTFGRSDSHDVVLKVEGVSRNHARIYPGDGTWGVEDLGSTNGIFVNKTKVEQSWLNAGDIVSIGKVHYKYGLANARPRAPTVPLDLNLNDTEKTLVIGRGARQEAEAEAIANVQQEPPAPPPGPSSTIANAPGASKAGASANRAAGAKAKDSSSAGLWLVVAIVAIAIVAGAYFALT